MSLLPFWALNDLESSQISSKNILICVPKLNEGLAGLEQREVINGIFFFGGGGGGGGVNYPFKEWLCRSTD